MAAWPGKDSRRQRPTESREQNQRRKKGSVLSVRFCSEQNFMMALFRAVPKIFTRRFSTSRALRNPGPGAPHDGEDGAEARGGQGRGVVMGFVSCAKVVVECVSRRCWMDEVAQPDLLRGVSGHHHGQHQRLHAQGGPRPARQAGLCPLRVPQAQVKGEREKKERERENNAVCSICVRVHSRRGSPGAMETTLCSTIPTPTRCPTDTRTTTTKWYYSIPYV